MFLRYHTFIFRRVQLVAFPQDFLVNGQGGLLMWVSWLAGLFPARRHSSATLVWNASSACNTALTQKVRETSVRCIWITDLIHFRGVYLDINCIIMLEPMNALHGTEVWTFSGNDPHALQLRWCFLRHKIAMLRTGFGATNPGLGEG